MEFERTHLTSGRHEAQRRGDGAAEPVDAQVDGELQAVGADWTFKQHVEELLAPVKVEIAGKPWPQHMGAGLFERRKGSVRRQRHQRGDDAGLLKQSAILVDVDIVGEPHLDAAADRLVGARKIEEGATHGEIGVD